MWVAKVSPDVDGWLCLLHGLNETTPPHPFCPCLVFIWPLLSLALSAYHRLKLSLPLYLWMYICYETMLIRITNGTINRYIRMITLWELHEWKWSVYYYVYSILMQCIVVWLCQPNDTRTNYWSWLYSLRFQCTYICAD